MSLVTEDIRSKAEVHYGDEVCQTKFKELLRQVEMPDGLIIVPDLEECGYLRETGFVWLKQKKKSEYRFETTGRLASYAPEITAYVEPRRIKKLSGVKSKELMIWVTVNEIYIDDPASGKITFKTTTGLSKSFPISAFDLKEIKKAKERKEAKEAKEGKEGKLVVVGEAK
ncbi:PREDICTED: uncharacterized protein LOC104605016 [Nelumbo nucifera]|uniref:Uncharacterized protein LOC104605016 n=1 Tax=Nelumbo nucifera TaxID=4432 RepID=A0A1U8AXW8_NELNU|nr:PREDICTED: uncharacterized protein LOC104605016 [Nelumbo nucifera]